MSISAADILAVTTQVTKEWTKQRKAEERGRSRASRIYIYSDRVYFSQVADAILPAAYAHASGDGHYSVAKRQLYYACREAFYERTNRQLEYPYFANTLLVQYLNRHPETDSWKVTADPRGTFTIPNTGHDVRIPCGTIQIDNYLAKTLVAEDEDDQLDSVAAEFQIHVEWPSKAAGHRYQAVLYIEKEGFGPMLEEAKIAEKFDLAILSCKGQSVVAARKLVDHVCAVGNGIPLLVVHDFDKPGFEISQRLTRVSDWAEDNDRVAYQFANDIDVHDLGLRLTDVRKYRLQEERCKFQGRFASDSICTEQEKEFLRSGRRVELNAFTSPQFIEWLESKLSACLGKKRLIPDDDVLANAYRRALAVAKINQTIEDALDEAIESAKAAKIPGLRRQLEKKLSRESEPWDKVLYELAQESLLSQEDED
jgi:hypothetical protein